MLRSGRHRYGGVVLWSLLLLPTGSPASPAVDGDIVGAAVPMRPATSRQLDADPAPAAEPGRETAGATLESLVEQGISDLSAGRDSLADDRFTRALALAPGHPEIIKWAVAARLRLRQPERARAVLSGIPDVAYDADTWRLAAEVHRQAGDADGVFDALQNAAASPPDQAHGAPPVSFRAAPDATAKAPMVAVSDVADDVLMPALSAAFTALHARRFEEVLKQAQTIGAGAGNTALWRAVAAVAELGMARARQARMLLQEAVAADPAFGFAWSALAEIALADGDSVEAERLYRASLAAEPGDLRGLMGMVRLARLAGAAGEERFWLTEAYRYHPRETQVLLQLAEVHLKAGDVGPAGQALAGLGPDQARNPEALRLLGLYTLQAGDFAAAIDHFSRLIALRPESREAWFQLARAQAAWGDPDSARHSFAIAIGLDPDHSLPLLRHALAALELRAGRFDEALVLAESVIEAHPGDVRAYDLQAAAHAGLGDQRQQLAALQAAYGLDPTLQRLRGLVDLLDRQGGSDRATALLAAWLEHHPGDYDVWLVKARRLERAGKLDAAVGAYEQAFQDPAISSDPAVLVAAARLYLRRQDGHALALAERAYHLAPTRPDVIGTFGWVSSIQGDRETGMTLLQQAVRMAPKDAVLSAYLDQAMSAQQARDAGHEANVDGGGARSTGPEQGYLFDQPSRAIRALP